MISLVLPPEISSTQIYTGPGAAPLAAAAAAWSGVAAELEQFAADHATVVAAIPWSGPSAVAFGASSAKLLAWAQLTAGQAAATAGAAAMAASAFEVVFATITPPTEVFANRSLLTMLIATNFLGQNFPAIATTEAQYMQMWAQNIASMSAYHATSALAVAATPTFDPLSSLSGVLDIFAPGSNQSTTGLAGLLNLLTGSSNSAFGAVLNSTVVNTLFSSGFYTPSSLLSPFTSLVDGGGSGSNDNSNGTPTPYGAYPGWNQDPYTAPTPNTGYSPGAITARAGMGQTIGRLSVPPNWAPNTTPAAPTALRLVSNPVPEAAPTAGVMPMPIGTGLGTGTPPRTSKPPPDYGLVQKVLNQHPWGG